MLTTYKILYTLLALFGIFEIATNTIGKSASFGLHIFFVIFTIIFVVHAIYLWRYPTTDTTNQTKIVRGTHGLTSALVVIAALLTWLLSI